MRKRLIMTLTSISKETMRRHWHNTDFIHVHDIGELDYIMGICGEIYETTYDTVIVERDIYRHITPEFEIRFFQSKPTKYVVL